MIIELEQQIRAFLAAHHVMSLATVGSSGPHATNLFYVCAGLALIWVSEPDTQHSREIEVDRRVAATVASNYPEFATIRGVQIVGIRLARLSAAAGPHRPDRQHKWLREWWQFGQGGKKNATPDRWPNWCNRRNVLQMLFSKNDDGWFLSRASPRYPNCTPKIC
jgi:hypothetical protein